MTNKMIEKINELDRDQAIEAARFISKSIAGDAQANKDDEALGTIVNDPYGHLPDVESLARLVLISASFTSEGKLEVERAIAGVGRKQFVLGGAEIVALAALGVVALKIIVTKGQGRKERRMIIRDDDGKNYVEIEEIDEPISITSDLAAILRSAFGLHESPDAES